MSDLFRSEICPDCAVGVGEAHFQGCDVARCLATGGQRLSCFATDHDCGRDTWTGEWPGVAECREFGWFQAGGDLEDLNRLVMEATWSPEQRRWVR